MIIQYYCKIIHFKDDALREQTGTDLDKDQLELWFTSFKICFIKLIKLSKLY